MRRNPFSWYMLILSSWCNMASRVGRFVIVSGAQDLCPPALYTKIDAAVQRLGTALSTVTRLFLRFVGSFFLMRQSQTYDRQRSDQGTI